MPVSLVYQDTFVRANAGNLGGNWNSGAWSISANEATSSVATVASYKGIAPADHVAVASEGVLSNHQWGPVARRVDDNNYYAARMDLAGGQVDLVKVVAGVTTSLHAPVGVTRAVGSQLEIHCVGTQVQVWYAQTLLFTVTDATFTLGGAGATGVYNQGAAAVYLNLFEARWDEAFTVLANSFKLSEEWNVEVVPYDSGYVQRNLVWTRPRRSMAVGYEYLNDTDKETLQYLYSRKGSSYRTFLIQDPTKPNPGSINPEDYAIADGTSTLYKVPIDKANAVTTYTDGVVDGAAVCLDTGVVVYVTPPYAGARLSYTATNAFYRVYFQAQTLEYARHVPNYWTASFQCVQEKTLLEGVAQ